MSGEWIEHSGKRRPVHRDERVYVTFRGSEPFYHPIDAGDLDWVHRGHSADIVAYSLVHKPNQKQKEAE
jgi:hypothetical protein